MKNDGGKEQCDKEREWGICGRRESSAAEILKKVSQTWVRYWMPPLLYKTDPSLSPLLLPLLFPHQFINTHCKRCVL